MHSFVFVLIIYIIKDHNINVKFALWNFNAVEYNLKILLKMYQIISLSFKTWNLSTVHEFSFVPQCNKNHVKIYDAISENVCKNGWEIISR